MNLEFEP